MDSSLSRIRGRFAGVAARTFDGFSTLAGCFTSAVARENSDLMDGASSNARFAAAAEVNGSVR
ncbi:MAG: hypothetical protein HYX27_14175 [Acidobacteria bacterium]|nr:hypothetical protein [Acidobacteriota bacterium]